MIKTLLVDDQKIFTDTLKFILSHDTEIEISGCARNGREAVELCRKYSPDIVLMDIVMPICDGVEATTLIKQEFKTIKVLVLTTFADDINVKNALRNGADGYLLKETDTRSLILAIKSVANGLGVLHENVLVNLSDRENKPSEVKVNSLNNKELEIISMIVNGKSNKDIASVLHFTEGNIRNTISMILKKLNLKDRTQLAIFAIKNNLV